MYSSCYCIRSCPCVSCGVFGKHHNLLAAVYPCYRVRYLRTHSSINLIINQRILHKINNKTIISITKFTTQSLGMTYALLFSSLRIFVKILLFIIIFYLSYFDRLRFKKPTRSNNRFKHHRRNTPTAHATIEPIKIKTNISKIYGQNGA